MESYQECSFEELLQDGRISEALQLRIEGMETIAYNTRVTMEASKAVTAGGVAIGVVFSANPLIALLAGIGGALYATALWKDFSTTNKLCPIPGMRKGLMEIIQGSGRADQGATHEEDPLILIQGYLEPQQRDEYEILVARESALTVYLKQFVGEQRLPAYRFAMRHARLQTYLNLPSVEQGREAIAVASRSDIVVPIAPSLPATQIQPAAPGQSQEDEFEDGAIQAAIYPPQNGDVAALPRLSDAVMSQDDKSSAFIDDRPSQPSPVDYLIGDRLRTALIVSVSGGGKDILLSNALRAFLAAYPDFRVVVADCKDDPKEYGYYANLPNVAVHRLNVAVSSDGEVIEWVDRWVEEFVHLPEQALLICNEGTLIRAKSKRYVQAIDGLVSSGDSRQKYAWEAGQSAHTDDLQINGAARSRFRMLIIGLKGEEMQIEAVLAAKFVADSARRMDDIRQQLMRSTVSRAWCDGQRWFAMPELKNYSGYNRDTRQSIGSTITPDQQVRARLEGLYQGEMKGETQGEIISHQGETGETVKRTGETGETPYSERGSDSGETGEMISHQGETEGETGEMMPDRAHRICEMKRAGLPQTQIIAIEFGAKPGKGQAYLEAVEEYKRIIDRHWQN